MTISDMVFVYMNQVSFWILVLVLARSLVLEGGRLCWRSSNNFLHYSDGDATVRHTDDLKCRPWLTHRCASRLTVGFHVHSLAAMSAWVSRRACDWLA